MELVKLYMKKLKNILRSNILYNILFLISLFYTIIYLKNYIPQYKYDIKDEYFILTINEIKIDGNKLSLIFKEDLIGNSVFLSS